MNRIEATTELREALRNLPAVSQWSATDPPDLDELVTPRGHARALDPNELVVEGDRGVGKSYWSAVLTFQDARIAASKAYPALGLDKLLVSLGFAQARRPEYPSATVLRTLTTIPAATIWKVVALRAAARELKVDTLTELRADKSWLQACTWVEQNPEAEEEEFARLDALLRAAEKRLLLVFDALDRIGGTDWNAVRRLVRGIMQAGLELRDSYPQFRFKAFLRSDFFNDEEIWRFPDASKLKGGAARLTWSTVDLYALLFRRVEQAGARPALELLQPRLIWTKLSTDIAQQNRAVVAMAGEFMGGVRRGRVFVWLPSHLSDARGDTSPRSFLLALRAAAEGTADNYPLVLSYLQIRDSVQRASEIRVVELSEDHPWLSSVLQALDGLVVPAERTEISYRFSSAGLQGQLVPAALAAVGPDSENEVPRLPVELSQGPLSTREFNDRLILALKRLYVVEERPDRRINVPDLFRVAARIKRKGGVPVARA